MVKKNRITLAILVIFSVSALAWYSLLFKEKTQGMLCLPADLMYDGAIISHICMYELLCGRLLGCQNPQEYIDLSDYTEIEKQKVKEEMTRCTFSWSYVGTLSDDNTHIVYAHLWPERAWGQYSGLYVIRRTGNRVEMVTGIASGDRHSSGIIENSWQLHDNQLTYNQSMTNYGFVDYLLDLFPDLKERVYKKSDEGLCYGEAGYFGDGTFKGTLGADGTLKNHRLISFDLEKSVSDAAREQYRRELEKTEPSSLSMGQALLAVVATFYQDKDKSTFLSLQQLKEMMEEILKYTKDKS
jgi:hypothetical protein